MAKLKKKGSTANAKKSAIPVPTTNTTPSRLTSRSAPAIGSPIQLHTAAPSTTKASSTTATGEVLVDHEERFAAVNRHTPTKHARSGSSSSQAKVHAIDVPASTPSFQAPAAQPNSPTASIHSVSTLGNSSSALSLLRQRLASDDSARLASTSETSSLYEPEEVAHNFTDSRQQSPNKLKKKAPETQITPNLPVEPILVHEEETSETAAAQPSNISPPKGLAINFDNQPENFMIASAASSPPSRHSEHKVRFEEPIKLYSQQQERSTPLILVVPRLGVSLASFAFQTTIAAIRLPFSIASHLPFIGSNRRMHTTQTTKTTDASYTGRTYAAAPNLAPSSNLIWRIFEFWLGIGILSVVFPAMALQYIWTQSQRLRG